MTPATEIASPRVLWRGGRKCELLLGQQLESSYTFRIVPWFDPVQVGDHVVLCF